MSARSFASIVAERLLVQRPGLGVHPAGRHLLCAATMLHDPDPRGWCRDCGKHTKHLPIRDGRTFDDVAGRTFPGGPT